jgi:hypothetical protein
VERNKQSTARPCGICADCSAAIAGEHSAGEDRQCKIRRDSIRARSGVDVESAYGDTYLDWRPRLRAAAD